MSQGDQSIINQAGAPFRADLNAELQALVSLSAGSGSPGTVYAHQLLADTATNTIWKRNAANSGWLQWRTLDEAVLLSRSSNTVLAGNDIGKMIVATAAFTQTFSAVASGAALDTFLHDGWWCDFINQSTGNIILDPNASEQINSGTTLTLYPGMGGRIMSNGSALFMVNSVGENATFVNPTFLAQTLTDQATIPWDCDLGQIAEVTITANRAVGAPTNLKTGSYILHVIQESICNLHCIAA